MRSAKSDEPPTTTARSRIRDAAILLMGERGVGAVSLREVATRCEVSPGLLIHHFGSRAGLVQACDDHVIDRLVTRKTGVAGAGAGGVMRAMLADSDRFVPLVDYMARRMMDAGEASDTFFDAMLVATREEMAVQEEQGLVLPASDPEVRAVFLTLYGLAPVLLRRHYARALGQDGLTEELLRRSTLPVLELFTHGLYRDDSLLASAREALADPPASREDLR